MSITALVLGAGASRRMGRPKALLELGGETYLGRIARTARAAGCAHVLVVLGPPDGERIQARLPPGVAATWNPDPGRGMLSSVQAGLASVPRGTLSVLVWPVDQPLVQPDTVRRILAAPPGRIVIPRCGGRGGHPVRIPLPFWGPILALPQEATLRQLFAERAAEVEWVEVEDAWAVQDIDTPEEAARAEEALQRD